MFNSILASLYDRLKVKNPTIALIIGCLLVTLFYGIDYLSGQIELPNWLNQTLPFLKGLLVALGLGLNSSTKPFRTGVTMMLFFVFFGTVSNAQLTIQVYKDSGSGGFYVETLHKNKVVGVSNTNFNLTTVRQFANSIKEAYQNPNANFQMGTTASLEENVNAVFLQKTIGAMSYATIPQVTSEASNSVHLAEVGIESNNVKVGINPISKLPYFKLLENRLRSQNKKIEQDYTSLANEFREKATKKEKAIAEKLKVNNPCFPNCDSIKFESITIPWSFWVYWDCLDTYDSSDQNFVPCLDSHDCICIKPDPKGNPTFTLVTKDNGVIIYNPDPLTNPKDNFKNFLESYMMGSVANPPTAPFLYGDIDVSANELRQRWVEKGLLIRVGGNMSRIVFTPNGQGGYNSNYDENIIYSETFTF